jgi:hypothetical protein
MITDDPAAFSRLVFLPARPINSSCGDIYTKIQELAPAFGQILFKEFLSYCKEGLLPVPCSMTQHRNMLIRYSARAAFKATHLALAECWLDEHVRIMSEGEVSACALTDRFVSSCLHELLPMGKVYHGQCSLKPFSAIASALLGTVFASRGVGLMNGAYQGVALSTQ